VNRIAGFLSDESEIAPAHRSPSQTKASRVNGTKGHGPLTDEGKMRSSRNAVKHGLLARRFAPPADARGDDLLFRKVHRELIAEFKLRTFIARMTVDQLASDVVQLTRCRQMVELLQRPASMTVEDTEQYQRLRDAERDLRSAQRLLGRLNADLKPDCTSKAAARIAASVAEAVRGLDEYVNQEDGLPEDQMDDTERREFVQYRDRWRVVKPALKKLLDTQHVAAVSQGMTKLGAAEPKRLRVALAQVIEDKQRIIAGQKKVASYSRQHFDETLLALATNPNALILLQRYSTRIERAIERKLRELRRV
jgi:hypothetical protein